VTLGFGVALGTRTAELIGGTLAAGAPGHVPAWLPWVAIVGTPFALTVIFQARLRELPWITFASLAAYAGARMGGDLWGPELGVFLGSLLAGLASGIYARSFGRPASVPMVPALMMLVPGALGFGSLQLFLRNEIVPGIELAFQVVLVATSLVSGILVASAVVRRESAL
jgi:uncharacterized membrane protein YjjB (DUF3815 family)